MRFSWALYSIRMSCGLNRRPATGDGRSVGVERGTGLNIRGEDQGLCHSSSSSSSHRHQLDRRNRPLKGLNVSNMTSNCGGERTCAHPFLPFLELLQQAEISWDLRRHLVKAYVDSIRRGIGISLVIIEN